METFNASSTAVPHDVYANIAAASPGFLTKALDSATPLNIFTAFLALFLAAVVYDQCMCLLSTLPKPSILTSIPHRLVLDTQRPARG
jgi:hypothetical protein